MKRYNPLRWLEYIFIDLILGYGVAPFRAILWASGLMLLFSTFYTGQNAIELRVERQKCKGKKTNGTSCNNYQKYGSEFCPKHQNQAKWKRRFRNALIFSVSTFTNVRYGDWHPVGIFCYIAMIEGFVGWLIMALFLVTFGKVWIR
ncbi:MAG: two pore domain potassium channel family protein [Candidatus Latescibacteria bacterium]|nr:two pore domain potassium channel family protein [Candidatus Latescibacterota bacterium]